MVSGANVIRSSAVRSFFASSATRESNEAGYFVDLTTIMDYPVQLAESDQPPVYSIADASTDLQPPVLNSVTLSDAVSLMQAFVSSGGYAMELGKAARAIKFGITKTEDINFFLNELSFAL